MARFFIESRLSPHMSETPEGFLLCEAVPIARAGELRYQPHETPITPGDGDTIIRRTADVIQSAEAIASFEGKPVTLHHPDDFVTPETWKELAVGVVQNVRPGRGADSDKLLADLLITDAQAIEEVRSGRLREVSCGYEAEYIEERPGVGRQDCIRGNHLALVHSGRCGAGCAIFDSAPQYKKERARMTVKNRLLRIFGRALDEELTNDPMLDADMGGTEEEAALAVDYDDPMLDADEDFIDADEDFIDADEDFIDADEDFIDADEGVVNEDFGERLRIIEDKLDRIIAAMHLDAMDSDEEVIVDADEDVMLDADEEVIVDADEDVIVDGDEDLMLDADEEVMLDEEQTCDAATAARAEILAPGISKVGNVKAKALKAAMQTKDGREVIERLMSGRRSMDVDTAFIAASEMLRAKRRSGLHQRPTIDNLPTIRAGLVTPAQINEMNAAHYGRK